MAESSRKEFKSIFHLEMEFNETTPINYDKLPKAPEIAREVEDIDSLNVNICLIKGNNH